MLFIHKFYCFPILIVNEIFHVTVPLGQDFDKKKFAFEEVHSKEVEKSWTKRGVNKLLKKLRDTGTVDWRLVSSRPCSARTEDKNSSGDEIANVNFFYNIAHVEASAYAH